MEQWLQDYPVDDVSAAIRREMKELFSTKTGDDMSIAMLSL